MIKFSKIRNVKSPNRGTVKSGGIDFFIPNDFNKVMLKPGENYNIPSGIKVNIPENFALVAFNKSGVALSGLLVGACFIDEDYQGELHLHVVNASNSDIQLNPGQKIVQFVLIPQYYYILDEVDESNLFQEKTERGENGFGSTGKY